MRSFGITTRLFGAILLVCLIMLGGMGLAMRVNFERGFLNYLGELEHERLAAFSDMLQEEYAQRGSWIFLQKDTKIWRKLVSRHIRQDYLPSLSGQAIPTAERNRRTWQAAQLHSTLGLVTADKTANIAGAPPGPNAIWHPVANDTSTIAWLTRDPLTGVTDNIDLRFQDQQSTAIWFIALLSLMLAIIVSLILARSFVAPIRHIIYATDQLARGDLTARVKIQTKDELRLLGDHVNLLADSLQTNESSRRTFMAEISHELRTPLAILRGEIEALEDGLRPVTRETLASLTAEVSILAHLINDIHELSLADLGALPYVKTRMNLADCLTETIRSFQERARLHSLILEYAACDQNLPVQADAGRIAQVIRNVLENSLRYTDSGGIIHIESHKEGAQAVIIIQDSAPGVPEDHLVRIFERFHTVDSSRNRKTSGTGLGLAICRSILEAHGGSILAAPSALGGLSLSIRLPLQEETSPEEFAL